MHPDDAAALAAALPAAGTDAGHRAGRHRAADPAAAATTAGEWRYLEAGVSDLRRDPDVGAVVLHCRDMTDRHAREQALQSVAYTDPMTGLPNRAGFLRPSAQALAGADRRRRRC